jgi:hypothetical protein
MRRPVLKWCGAAVLGSFIVHCSKRRTLSMLEMGGWIQQSIPAIHYLKGKYTQEPTVDCRHKISSSVGNNALKTKLGVKSQPQDWDRELKGQRELVITAAMVLTCGRRGESEDSAMPSPRLGGSLSLEYVAWSPCRAFSSPTSRSQASLKMRPSP